MNNDDIDVKANLKKMMRGNPKLYRKFKIFLAEKEDWPLTHPAWSMATDYLLPRYQEFMEISTEPPQNPIP